MFSAHPVADDWQPAQRSNSNFSVSIVDRDASQLALAFQRLTASAGNEESQAYQALLEACMYVLRLSNMPAGYTDLTAASAEAGAAIAAAASDTPRARPAIRVAPLAWNGSIMRKLPWLMRRRV